VVVVGTEAHLPGTETQRSPPAVLAHRDATGLFGRRPVEIAPEQPPTMMQLKQVCLRLFLDLAGPGVARGVPASAASFPLGRVVLASAVSQLRNPRATITTTRWPGPSLRRRQSERTICSGRNAILLFTNIAVFLLWFRCRFGRSTRLHGRGRELNLFTTGRCRQGGLLLTPFFSVRTSHSVWYSSTQILTIQSSDENDIDNLHYPTR